MFARLKLYGLATLGLALICFGAQYYFQQKLEDGRQQLKSEQEASRKKLADTYLEVLNSSYTLGSHIHGRFKTLAKANSIAELKAFKQGLDLSKGPRPELMTWALMKGDQLISKQTLEGAVQTKEFYERIYKRMAPNSDQFEFVVVDNRAMMMRMSRIMNTSGDCLVISRLELNEAEQKLSHLLSSVCWAVEQNSKSAYLRANSAGVLRIWSDVPKNETFETFSLEVNDAKLIVLLPKVELNNEGSLWDAYYQDRIRIVWILGATLLILIIVLSELRKSAEDSRFYKNTMSSLSSFGIFILDDTGAIKRHNKYFPTLMDSAEKSLINKKFTDLVDYNEQDFLQVLQALALDGEEVDIILKHEVKGEITYKELHLSTFVGKGKTQSFTGTVNDVSARELNHQKIEKHEHDLEKYNEAICRILEIPVDDHEELESLLNEICKVSSQVLGASTSMIWLLDEKSQGISCQARVSIVEKLPSLDEWHMDVEGCASYIEVLEQTRVQSIARVQEHPCYEKMHGLFEFTGAKSRLDAIIRVHLKSRGVLVFEKQEERSWSKAEISFAASVADQISVLINIYDSLNEQETLRIARQQAEELSEAKGDFLAIMSHELRTPLNAIIGFTELLKLNKELDTDSRYYVDALKKSSQGLLGLVNNILDFSKMEAQKLDLNIETKSLLAICLAACDMVSSLADKKNINLNMSWEVPSTLMVDVDEGRFQQVLVNLMSNALKFTTEGHVMLLVKPEGKDKVRIAVEDTGCGIPKDKEESLFEKFFQVDSSNKRKHGGTGLGLPIAKSLVEMMGGELSLNNKPNIGCTFSFALPLSADQDTLTVTYKKHTVLLYSENQDAVLQKQLLENYGLEVLLYQDLYEAQAAIHAGVSFVLCDLTSFDFSKPLTPISNFVGKIKRKSPPALVCAMIRFGQYADDIMACGFTNYFFPPFFRTDAILSLIKDELPKVESEVDDIMQKTCVLDLSEVVLVQEIITLSEGEKYKVLILSDNSLLRIRVNLVLKKFATQVDAASCIDEFNEFIAESSYHYIFADVNFSEQLNLNESKFLDSRPRLFGLGESNGESLVEGVEQYLAIPLQPEELESLFIIEG